MERVTKVLSILEESISTKRKRHILGGTFISIALLFGGIALTIISFKNERNLNDEQHD